MIIKQNFKIKNIPAILWGNKSDKLFVVVHGNMSNKADDLIVVFAEETTAIGLVSICLNMVTVMRKLMPAKFKTVFKTLRQ